MCADTDAPDQSYNNSFGNKKTENAEAKHEEFEIEVTKYKTSGRQTYGLITTELNTDAPTQADEETGNKRPKDKEPKIDVMKDKTSKRPTHASSANKQFTTQAPTHRRHKAKRQAIKQRTKKQSFCKCWTMREFCTVDLQNLIWVLERFT